MLIHQQNISFCAPNQQVWCPLQHLSHCSATRHSATCHNISTRCHEISLDVTRFLIYSTKIIVYVTASVIYVVGCGTRLTPSEPNKFISVLSDHSTWLQSCTSLIYLSSATCLQLTLTLQKRLPSGMRAMQTNAMECAAAYGLNTDKPSPPLQHLQQCWQH